MGLFKFSSASLAGPGFVVLNGLKVMNLIAFMIVVCANVVMLVRIKTDSPFFFFDAVRHVITAAICIFLTVSEIPIFPRWFERNWPVLSLKHGFVTLGLAMLAIGVDTLGNLNEETNSKDNLGLAFWRIVIGSGCLIFILGVFNILASYIFRDRIVGVSAREVRAYGKPAILDARALAENQARGKSFATSSSSSSASLKTPKVSIGSPESKKSSKRWTHRFNKPVLPTYHQSQKGKGDSSPGTASSKYTFSDAGTEQHEMKISGPLNANPHFANLPGLIRPDSTYHPYRHAK